jgi:hypothetical protein
VFWWRITNQTEAFTTVVNNITGYEAYTSTDISWVGLSAAWANVVDISMNRSEIYIPV